MNAKAELQPCGHYRRPLPEWVEPGTLFWWGGEVWRVLSVGSTNRRAPSHCHFEDAAMCVRAKGWVDETVFGFGKLSVGRNPVLLIEKKIAVVLLASKRGDGWFFPDDLEDARVLS